MFPVKDKLRKLTVVLWPAPNRAPEEESQAIMVLAIVLVNLPLALLSLLWLTAVADWVILQRRLPLLAVLVLALVLLGGQQYQVLVKLPGHPQRLPVSSSLISVLHWALVLIFGPAVIWLFWLSSVITVVRLGKQPGQVYGPLGRLWISMIALVQNYGPSTLSLLAAVTVYAGIGGVFPLASPQPTDWLPALGATAAYCSGD